MIEPLSHTAIIHEYSNSSVKPLLCIVYTRTKPSFLKFPCHNLKMLQPILIYEEKTHTFIHFHYTLCYDTEHNMVE
jgi:hypothetical protein